MERIKFLESVKISRFTRPFKMEVQSKLQEFKNDYMLPDERFRDLKTRSECLMNRNFWIYIKGQIVQADLMEDHRTRLPGLDRVLKHVTLDLLDMSIIARLNENPRSVLISTEMVRSLTLPVEGFDSAKLRKWFYNQRYYRDFINQEILELIMVNKFIRADPDRIPLEDQFWRLSDPCMEALNKLAFLAYAAQIELQDF